MGIKSGKIESGSGVNIPIEPTIGLLAGAVHLGVQKNTVNGETSLVDQVFVQFELQDVVDDKGRPALFGKVMRNSLHKKASMVELGNALGVDMEVGLDLESLVGSPVMLDIQKTSTGKPKISKFTKVRSKDRETTKPLMNTPRFLGEVEEISESQLKELPEWIQKKISERVRPASSGHSSHSGSVDL